MGLIPLRTGVPLSIWIRGLTQTATECLIVAPCGLIILIRGQAKADHDKYNIMDVDSERFPLLVFARYPSIARPPCRWTFGFSRLERLRGISLLIVPIICEYAEFWTVRGDCWSIIGNPPIRDHQARTSLWFWLAARGKERERVSSATQRTRRSWPINFAS